MFEFTKTDIEIAQLKLAGLCRICGTDHNEYEPNQCIDALIPVLRTKPKWMPGLLWDLNVVFDYKFCRRSTARKLKEFREYWNNRAADDIENNSFQISYNIAMLRHIKCELALVLGTRFDEE